MIPCICGYEAVDDIDLDDHIDREKDLEAFSLDEHEERK